MRNIVGAFLVFLAIPAAAIADTWGPVEGHTVVDMRAYTDGSLVFRFTPALAAGCQYNDHAITPTSSPAYKLISAFVMSAFNMSHRVRLIYDGCHSGGNVNVTGVTVVR